MAKPPRWKKNTLVAGVLKGLSHWFHLPWVLSLVWRATRYWTVVWAVLLLVQGCLPISTVYLTRLIVDSLVAAQRTGFSWESARSVLPFAGLMAGVLLLAEILRGLQEWVRTVQAELLQDYIAGLIHQKSVAVDLAFYESPAYHDRLDQARSDASSRSLELLENGGSLLQNSLTLLAMAVVLIPYGAWLPVALLVSTLPAFFVLVKTQRRYHRWWEERTKDRRLTQYFDLMLTYGSIAAELRLFGLGSYFQSSYQSLRKRLRTERLQLVRSQTLARLGAGLLGLLASGAALLWMGLQVVRGSISLGDLALFYQAFNQGQSLMRGLLGNAGAIYTSSLFISNLLEFLDLDPQIVDPPTPIPVPAQLSQGIRFHQITFRYPGSEQPILEGFNLEIPAGKIVAIVGANGSGKSTLLKLLCRFYDPEAGHIELDGIDLRCFAVKEYRQMLAVLFQSPVPYNTTAAQNIALGNFSNHPTPFEIETAARGAGAHEIIERLPQGYDTQLGKWYAEGAVDLSGGEWQRIALSRAFLRRSPIVILDEPTSAMDSWAEIDWLNRFRTLTQGRTGIVITHRFTLAKRADVIHVMRKGQIVESGSHDQLLAQAGLYAQSWKTQMEDNSHTPQDPDSKQSDFGRATL